MRKYIISLVAALIFAFGSYLLVSCGGGDDGGSGGGGGEEGNIPSLPKNRNLAFPGAEGGASKVTGGAGQQIYIVTNLNDDGAGSFRDAVAYSGRTIVFAVSGTINLEKDLNIDGKKNITIAGQSAPGGGITLAGYPVKISKGENIIVRYIRFRLGDQNGSKSNFDPEAGDALEVKDSKDIMIDHCSMSWSTDECASFSRVENLTVQYCFITESLRKSIHVKGNHGYGGIWGGKNATYYHNLLADHDSRNPRFDHQYVATASFLGPINYVNNVVYNWGGNSTYGGEACDGSFHINMVNNFYKPGPNSLSHPNRLLEMTSSCDNCTKDAKSKVCKPGYFYISGNNVNGTANHDWNGVDNKNTSYKLSSRFTDGVTVLVFEESASDAYSTVLNYSGASYSRDAVDDRIVTQVKGNTGALIDNTPAYPELAKGTPIADLDKDGMPDSWEEQQLQALGVKGKTYKDFSPRTYNLSGKYTNLEVYLNELVAKTFPAGAKASQTR